jgi:hypothetical protein
LRPNKVCVLLLDSSKASQVLLNQNIELMGCCCCCCCCWRMQEKAFGAPCPTRFANHVFCLEDVVRSKQAFQLMVIDHRWEEASSSVAGKEELLRIITGGNNTRFWQEAEVVLEITKPIKDAIHTVETDKPLLSQMLPMYETLERHLQQQHDTGSPAVKRLKLPDLLDKRMCGAGGKGKLWHSSFSASYLLDPMQWVKDRAGDWGPNFSKLSAAQLEEAEQCVIRITPEDQQETVKAEWEALRFDGFDSKLTSQVMPTLTARQQQPDGSVITASVKRRRKWWAATGATVYPIIAAAAERLLAMPVTTCAAERNWSVWGQVYTKLRNRLGIERGEMIVFIRHNLAMQGAQLSEDEDVAMQVALAAAEG